MRAPTADDCYVYAVELVRVIDGDTVVLDIDLGCESWLRGQHCRLLGINAPEPHGETRNAGIQSGLELARILSRTRELLVRTHFDKKGSFRRLLVELWADGCNVNEELVRSGHAVRMP